MSAGEQIAIVSNEQIETIAELRQRARGNGPPLDRETLKRALALLRGDRTRAGAVSSKARTVKASAGKAIDSDALLGELDGL